MPKKTGTKMKTVVKAVKEEVKKETKKVVETKPHFETPIDALDNADAEGWKNSLLSPFMFPGARIPDANGRYATTSVNFGLLPIAMVADSLNPGDYFYGFQYNGAPAGGFRQITASAAGALSWGGYTDLPNAALLTDGQLIRQASAGVEVIFDTTAYSTIMCYVNTRQYAADTSDSVAELGNLSTTRIYTGDELKKNGGAWGAVVPFALDATVSNPSGQMIPGLTSWRPATVAVTDVWVTIIFKMTLPTTTGTATGNTQFVTRFVSSQEMVPLPAYVARYKMTEIPPADAQFERSWGAALIKGGADMLNNLVNMTQGLIRSGVAGRAFTLGYAAYRMYRQHKGIITHPSKFPEIRKPNWPVASSMGASAAPAAYRRHDMACALGAPHLSPFNRKYRVLPDDIIAFGALVQSLIDEERKQQAIEEEKKRCEDEHELKLIEAEAKAVEQITVSFKDLFRKMVETVPEEMDWKYVEPVPAISQVLPQVRPASFRLFNRF